MASAAPLSLQTRVQRFAEALVSRRAGASHVQSFEFLFVVGLVAALSAWKMTRVDGMFQSVHSTNNHFLRVMLSFYTVSVGLITAIVFLHRPWPVQVLQHVLALVLLSCFTAAGGPGNASG